jgi:hypothetical protein
MRATDPRLAVLAKQAGVRPPHVHFVWHYRASLKDHFDPAVCADAAQLELRHVERILAVLGEPVRRVPRVPSVKRGLSEGWEMPQEWLDDARTRRFWPMDVCRTEADRFYNWHRMKGSQFADWKAAWINWITRSNRENGTVTMEGDRSFADIEAQRAYLAKLKD